jgi:hypothetical protein
MPVPPYSQRGNKPKRDTLAHEKAAHGFAGATISAEPTRDPRMETGTLGAAGAQIRSVQSGDAGASEALKGARDSGTPATPAKSKAPVMGKSTREWDKAAKKREGK